jgi:hypothetical protein
MLTVAFFIAMLIVIMLNDVLLNVIMLNDVLLNVVMLSVILLSVEAPYYVKAKVSLLKGMKALLMGGLGF